MKKEESCVWPQNEEALDLFSNPLLLVGEVTGLSWENDGEEKLRMIKKKKKEKKGPLDEISTLATD